MALKFFESKEAVPEAQRESAIETKDGKFAVEDAELGDAGKQAIDRERTRAEKAEQKAREAEEKDKLKDAELAQLKREAEARKNGTSEEELQKQRDREKLLLKPVEEERDALKTERDTLQAEVQTLRLDERVKKLGIEYGMIPERQGDAMVILKQRLALGDKNGIIVKDEHGEPTTETIESFLKTTFKKDKPYFYFAATTGRQGSGARQSQTGDEREPMKDDAVNAKRREVAGAF